jgi:hypothetical protein
VPGEGGAPGEGNVPGEGDAPCMGNAPGEGRGPGEGDAPRESCEPGVGSLPRVPAEVRSSDCRKQGRTGLPDGSAAAEIPRRPFEERLLPNVGRWTPTAAGIQVMPKARSAASGKGRRAAS